MRSCEAGPAASTERPAAAGRGDGALHLPGCHRDLRRACVRTRRHIAESHPPHRGPVTDDGAVRPRRKAEHYRTIESLRAYVLIGQDHPRVERYARTGERQWTLTEAIGPEDTIALDAIGCVLSLSDVYEDID
jgi:hypothetical protein